MLLSIAAIAQQWPTHIDKYMSPDRTLVAVITSRKAPQATEESKIELISNSGNVLEKESYFSEDGEHGFGVTKAAWTPDSNFFLYSMESSGGHQSWHSPVYVFRRKTNNIFNLDKQLRDSIANPQFEITAPDKVKVKLFFSKRTVTVTLSSMRVEQN